MKTNLLSLVANTKVDNQKNKKDETKMELLNSLDWIGRDFFGENQSKTLPSSYLQFEDPTTQKMDDVE